ncbi:hypothetical protein BE17_41420 [Sorangium cellulosum]|uniref:Uncharacterized protein n=1 Tax=Sorangium cellulosum TaxID=56 RepID=A0A150S8Q6_SORCE|nr:hypothetical protein BE17_41420 [Sorangium cellulosum]
MAECERETERDPGERPGLVLRAFEHDGRYVLGFPLHVALTLCADPPSTCVRGLPLASWAGNAGAIGIRLIDPATGNVVLSHEPFPVVLPELGTSTFTLSPGACRRMLVDVSRFLPADLAPGRYDLVILYGAPSRLIESPVARVELAAPSAAEREELDRLEPELALVGSWGRWTNLRPRHGERIEPPRGSLDPLRFNRVLRYLMFGPEGLSDVDPALLDVLHGVYEPEFHALLAELYAARGDAARLAEQAAIIRTSYPGLAWWIDEIEAGRSAIAAARGG